MAVAPVWNELIALFTVPAMAIEAFRTLILARVTSPASAAKDDVIFLDVRMLTAPAMVWRDAKADLKAVLASVAAAVAVCAGREVDVALVKAPDAVDREARIE